MTLDARELAELLREARLLQDVMDLAGRCGAPPPAPLLDAVLLGRRRGREVLLPQRCRREP